MPDPGEPRTEITGRNVRAGHLPVDEPGRRRMDARLEAETATVRAELLRVDAKANSLLGIAGVLLGGGLALLAASAPKMPAAAAAVGWAAVAVVGAAVVLLAWALRPNLAGRFGFVRWAMLPNLDELLRALREPGDPLMERADALRWLSCALLAKYRAVRWAVTFLVVGLALGAVCAALTAWAR